MLATPRTLLRYQNYRQDLTKEGFSGVLGWRDSPEDIARRARMLLLHQKGSVKVGEVVR